MGDSGCSNRPLIRKKIWDPAIRAWHWLLAASVTTGWLLGEFRDFSTVEWHIYLGYCTGTLLLLRMIWGFAGPAPVKFAALFHSPARLARYLRRVGVRAPSGVSGHNPLGALSVVAMLSLLVVQVGTGLFAEDDTLFASGPLSGWLSSGGVVRATSIHHIGATLLLIFVGIHVSAVLFYWVWKRENLVLPMITGWKWVRSHGEDDRD